MNPSQLLSHFDRISEAPDAVPRLRRFILELAVRGKLVDQDLKDDPASYLLMRIQAENRQMENTFHPLAEDEKPFTIPQSWAWIRLGNAAHVEMGQSPPSENYNQSGDGIPFYQGKTDFGLRHPTPRYWCDLPSKLAQKNDILISVRAPVGPTNVASEECCIGRGLAALRPHHGVYLEFLLYSLKGFESAIAAMGYGTTFVAITKKQLVSFAVPLPPLAEQHRIVSKVDELMALCDRLEAAQAERESRRDRLVASSLNRLNNGADLDAFRDHAHFYFNHLPRLTTRSEHIQQLRQTILNLAVRGKLVTQDPTDEPASDLLKRIQVGKMPVAKNGVVKEHVHMPSMTPEVLPFNIPVGWTWVRLQQLLEPKRDISYGVIKLGDEPKTGGVYTLRCSDVKPRALNLANVRKVGEEVERDYLRTRLVGGEILLNIRGTLGGVALVPSDLKGYNVAREVAVIPIYRELFGEYLVNVMASPYFGEAILEGLRGIAYKGLNLKTLRLFGIPLPPLAEQQRIVAKVDELMALCDRLEAQLTTTHTEIRRLLDAVLHESLCRSRN